MAGKVGGARPGAGRRPIAEGGKPNIVRPKASITALRDDLSMVDILIKAAYECYDAAVQIKPEKDDDARRVELSSVPYDDLKKPEKQELRALEFKIKERRRLMDAAADYADRAAPYIHSKLSSITHGDDPENPVGVAEGFNAFATAINKLAEAKVLSK